MNLYGRMIHGAEIQWLKMDSDSVYHVFTWSGKQFDNKVCIICCTLEQLLQYSYHSAEISYMKWSIGHFITRLVFPIHYFMANLLPRQRMLKTVTLANISYHLTSSKNYYSKVLLSYGLPSFYMRMYACVYQPSEFIYLALSRSDW